MKNVDARQDSAAPTPGLTVAEKPTVALNSGVSPNSAINRAFQVVEPPPLLEYLRLPKPGHRCRYTGLSRTTLIEGLERGDYRGITVRKPGATRGIRLINIASLQAYLARLDREQNSGRSTSPSEGQA